MSEQQQPSGSKDDLLITRMRNALEKLAKWRTVFAGRFFGTFPSTYVPGQAYREDIEARLIMRAELNALVRILIQKKLITNEEWMQNVGDEALTLDRMLEAKFPGIKTTQQGVSFDAVAIRDNHTMDGWPQ